MTGYLPLSLQPLSSPVIHPFQRSGGYSRARVPSKVQFYDSFDSPIRRLYPPRNPTQRFHVKKTNWQINARKKNNSSEFN
ncbi:hypothetical protein PUN28_016168 [Cardiocondyla obscurior]|uniref:Uncharacterized protein n=1 Tax=Cardiocondyla obscurior TaxID=286306 RepID=A0AAW2EUW7_9HYME